MSGLLEPTIEHWILRGRLNNQLAALLVWAIWTVVGLFCAPIFDKARVIFVLMAIAGAIGMAFTFRAIRRTWNRMKYLEAFIP